MEGINQVRKKRTTLVADYVNNRFYANGVEITKSVYESLCKSGEEFAGNTGFGSELAKASDTSSDGSSFKKYVEETNEMFKRNTPKKPILKKFGEMCPNCKDWVYNKHAHIKTYCETCGQAIDWTDIIKTLKEYDNE